jgi:glycosyltransferase involved in cell wall biosynthesis
MKRLTINQTLPTVSYGDAVSNSAIAIMKVLREIGYKSDIFAQDIHPKVQKYVKHIDKYEGRDKSDILIHHFSTGSEVNDYVCNLKNTRKIMVYHNITPKEFFDGYNAVSYSLCKKGRQQLIEGKDTYEMALAVSEYNRKELDEIGYRNTKVLPIIIDFSDFKQEPDGKVIKKYSDGNTNILFLGRIAPNKKQEDIIKSFYYYKKYIDKQSRLFIVGSYNGMERYYNELKELVKYLDLEDVYFTGHIPFKEMLSYYHIADLFLCMSEHEGFCVPLVESMYFKVPIIAYNSCAVPETLGKAGIIVNQKDYRFIAEIINQVIQNKELRDKLIKNQIERLNDFNESKTIEKFKIYLNEFLG